MLDSKMITRMWCFYAPNPRDHQTRTSGSDRLADPQHAAAADERVILQQPSGGFTVGGLDDRPAHERRRDSPITGTLAGDGECRADWLAHVGERVPGLGCPAHEGRTSVRNGRRIGGHVTYVISDEEPSHLDDPHKQHVLWPDLPPAGAARTAAGRIRRRGAPRASPAPPARRHSPGLSPVPGGVPPSPP